MIAILTTFLLLVITVGAAAALVLGIHPYAVALAVLLALVVVRGISRALR